MAMQKLSGGEYISKAGGNIRRWQPVGYVLQAGEIGWDSYPTGANLASVSHASKTRRTLAALLVDLLALSTAQKNAIWTDLTSGSPAKILDYVGANAASLFVLHWASSNASLPAASIADAKARAAAMYVQDNPMYLVNPSFDPTINVPGES